MARRVGSLMVCLGAALVIAACGGDAAPARTAHTALPGEPPLVQVDGYTYQDPTATDLEIAHVKDFLATADEMPQMFTAVSAHRVEGAGGAAWLLQAQLGPVLSDPDMQEQMLRGSLTDPTSDSPAALETISGELVSVGMGESVAGKSVLGFMWIHEGVMSTMFGDDADKTREFVTEYLAVANAPSE
ncbi:hypothetical protein [Longivirga aurantiaca]|uniref:Lipoprotein n=1 Tax=Longivirga aurantiaca TaxID=1837743 RepID=A0ABW1T168_9ACTN